MSLPSGVFQASYGQDMAIFRTKTHWVLLLAFFALLFTLPAYSGDRLLTNVTIIGITIISVLGLNILTGYCGQISMGHAGFMAVGGYVSAVLTVKLGLSFWVALPCAGLGAGLVGIIFGLPSLKIKGFYLIMSTVAAYFIIIWIILQLYGVTGGADGMSLRRPAIGDFIFKSKASYFYLVMIITCIAVYVAKNIVRTRAGRAFIAIRDNDLAAEVMGVNLEYQQAGSPGLAFYETNAGFRAEYQGCLGNYFSLDRGPGDDRGRYYARLGRFAGTGVDQVMQRLTVQLPLPAANGGFRQSFKEAGHKNR